MLATIDEAVTPRPSTDVILERLEQLEERRDDSSRRLHLEIEDLRRRQDALAVLQSDTTARLARMDASPLDADKIRFAPRVVVAIVAACLSIVLGAYAVNYGMRSDLRDLVTRQEQRDRLEEVNRKLADQQTEAITKAVDVIDKRQQLQQIQIQELKEMVLSQTQARR